MADMDYEYLSFMDALEDMNADKALIKDWKVEYAQFRKDLFDTTYSFMAVVSGVPKSMINVNENLKLKMMATYMAWSELKAFTKSIEDTFKGFWVPSVDEIKRVKGDDNETMQ